MYPSSITTRVLVGVRSRVPYPEWSGPPPPPVQCEGVTLAPTARPVEVKDGQLTIQGWGFDTGKCMYLSKVAVRGMGAADDARGAGADQPAKAVQS